MDKEMLKKLIEEKMIYFFLVSLISSDNLNNENDYNKSIKILNDTRLVLMDLDVENKEKYIQYVDDSLSLLKKEFESFQEN